MVSSSDEEKEMENMTGNTEGKKNAGSDSRIQTHDQQTEGHRAVADNILSLDDIRVKYDPDKLHDFIKLMFHTRPDPQAQVLVHLSKSAPRGFGLPAEVALTPRRLKTSAPLKGYFSTSMLRPQKDGTLRHTKEAFASFHVLVLDDIGTKIPWTKLPEALVENANIETSPGNHQLMFTLAKPITDYEEAQLLIDLFVDAGLTDGGGAMPIKKVRLPCGVNGKKSADKALFRVKLISTSPDPWDIQELLDAAGIDVNWEKYRLNAKDQRFRASTKGAAGLRTDLFHVERTGIFDPVLEFLHSRGEVIQDSQDGFMDIICPFHVQHSGTGLEDKLCGYSPLGHGKYPQSRKFHCFHDHCKDRTHEDFLDEIHALGGPLMPARDAAAGVIVGLAYDVAHDVVYNLRETQSLIKQVPLRNMQRLVPMVTLPTGKTVNPLDIWIRSGSITVVNGAISDPCNPDRIIGDGPYDKVLNIFNGPNWPLVRPNMGKIAPFFEFINYLIPDKTERMLLLRWLACKMQDITFRGPGMIIVSQTQGVGKNTLMNILGKLLGMNNVMVENLTNMVGDRASAYNNWAEKLLVCIDETLAFGDPSSAHRVYNQLKTIVDTTPKTVTMNKKYQPAYTVNCVTSFILFSNHLDAVFLHHGDRRFNAVSGPVEKRGSKYFEHLYKWINTGGWEVDLWNWFRGVKVNPAEVIMNAGITNTMKAVRENGQSYLDNLIEGIVKCWPADIISAAVFKQVTPYFSFEREMPAKYELISKKIYRDRLVSLHSNKHISSKYNIEGVTHYLYLRNPRIVNDPDRLRHARRRFRAAMRSLNPSKFAEQVQGWMDENGHN
jgi:hypothetical protein